MNVDEATRQKVAEWIEQGLKLSDIQNRLGSELGITLTYMETRFLVDDLKLTPKEQAAREPLAQLNMPSAGAVAQGDSLPEMGTEPAQGLAEPEDGALPPVGTGTVSLSVDRLARPGALVSGSVTFSDGNSGTWYLDQLGRLAISPAKQGYRPAPADVQAFQLQLQNELAKLGM